MRKSLSTQKEMLDELSSLKKTLINDSQKFNNLQGDIRASRQVSLKQSRLDREMVQEDSAMNTVNNSNKQSLKKSAMIGTLPASRLVPFPPDERPPLSPLLKPPPH